MAMSRCMLLFISSGALPSANIDTPLARNLLLTSWRSSAIMPSLRATLARSTIWSIRSSGRSNLFLKVLPITLKALKNSAKDERNKATISVPPITIISDGVFTKRAGSSIAIAIKPNAPNNPRIVAISIDKTLNPLLELIYRSEPHVATLH